MFELSTKPDDILANWVRDRTQLDYWFESGSLTTFGIEGIRSVGECVITMVLRNILLMRTAKGTNLHMLDGVPLVVENFNHSPDGFRLQVRTSNHSTWILLKPHIN